MKKKWHRWRRKKKNSKLKTQERRTRFPACPSFSGEKRLHRRSDVAPRRDEVLAGVTGRGGGDGDELGDRGVGDQVGHRFFLFSRCLLFRLFFFAGCPEAGDKPSLSSGDEEGGGCFSGACSRRMRNGVSRALESEKREREEKKIEKKCFRGAKESVALFLFFFV